MRSKIKTPRKKASVPTEPATDDCSLNEPQTVRVHILRRFPNPRWLMGALPDGMACRVEAPRYHADKAVGCTVEATAQVDAAGETYYKYAP